MLRQDGEGRLYDVAREYVVRAVLPSDDRHNSLVDRTRLVELVLADE